MVVEASNKSLTRRSRRGKADGGVDARLILSNPSLLRALLTGIYALVQSNRSPWLYVAIRDIRKVAQLRRLTPYQYRILHAALLRLSRVYGFGTYATSDRTYFILDATKLKAMTKDELAKEIERIINEGDGA